VLYILRRRGRDDDQARDLCQETFRITIERLRDKPLEDPSKLTSYMHSVAVNLCIADNRKTVRRQTFADSDSVALAAEQGLDQFAALSSARAAETVRRLLAELLSERDQKILFRYYIEEQEKHEICDALSLSHRHFDKVISRARTRFRQMLEASGQDSLLELVRGGRDA
jgi:RNA polymerase sigma-70 factor (ECF subfamily)